MEKININGIELSYEIIDCANKLVIIKVPNTVILSTPVDNLIELRNYFIDECNAKNAIVVCNDIDFETMDKQDTLNLINKYISELFRLKEKLLEGDE